MKEKFIELLEANGIAAEMGITPKTDVYVMHLENEDGARDFWFVETDGSVEAVITNFVRWNIAEYIFACVKDEDYENGKYMTGEIKELKDFMNPQGVSEEETFMTMSFEELLKSLSKYGQLMKG